MIIKYKRITKSSKWIIEDQIYILPSIIFRKKQLGLSKSITLKFLWLKKWVEFMVIYE